MEYITKRISHLAKVSRGLDRSHPEFKQQPIDKLAKSLRKAIHGVSVLEHSHDELGLNMSVARSIAVDAIQMIEDDCNKQDVVAVIVELINTIDGMEA